MQPASPIDGAADAACPRCGFQPLTAGECGRCGVVASRWSGDAPRRPTPPPQVEVEPLSDCLPARSVDREGRQALAIGAVLALVLSAIPFTRFVFSYFTILVHELGHAATGWLFGHPSIPAFDFVYGGGVTSIQDRHAGLLVLIYVTFAVGLYLYRRHPPAYLAIGAIGLVHAALTFSPLGAHAIHAMGHGAELVFASIFFYRALSGVAVRIPIERPLYAFLAFFVILSDLRFAWGLTFDPLARDIYGELKGGGHWMDFSVLARDLGLSLSAVAGSFLLAVLATLPLTLLGFRYRDRLDAVWHRLFQPGAALD